MTIAEKTNVKADFEQALRAFTGLSPEYCDAAWHSIRMDSALSTTVAVKAAANYAAKFDLFQLNQPIFQMTADSKGKIANAALGLGLEDLPEFVTSTENLNDFLEALNEHIEDCALIRIDFPNFYSHQSGPLSVAEAAQILLR